MRLSLYIDLDEDVYSGQDQTTTAMKLGNVPVLPARWMFLSEYIPLNVVVEISLTWMLEETSLHCRI
jgi:hypothetical protein